MADCVVSSSVTGLGMVAPGLWELAAGADCAAYLNSRGLINDMGGNDILTHETLKTSNRLRDLKQHGRLFIIFSKMCSFLPTILLE